MYINAKMILVETIPRTREWGIKENRGEFNSDL
jgi:hypothetical protein